MATCARCEKDVDLVNGRLCRDCKAIIDALSKPYSKSVSEKDFDNWFASIERHIEQELGKNEG